MKASRLTFAEMSVFHYWHGYRAIDVLALHCSFFPSMLTSQAITGVVLNFLCVFVVMFAVHTWGWALFDLGRVSCTEPSSDVNDTITVP